jgi:hypothetical protein
MFCNEAKQCNRAEVREPIGVKNYYFKERLLELFLSGFKSRKY